MRPIFPGDLDHAVRVILALPPDDRLAAARSLIGRADLADRFRKRTGRAHPLHGTGSILSATGGLPKAALPDYCNPAYCAALADFIEAYLDHHNR